VLPFPPSWYLCVYLVTSTAPHHPTLAASRRYFGLLLAVLGGILLWFNRDALLRHPGAPDPAGPPPAARTAPDPATPAARVTFAVFDTETTGLDAGIDRLLELAVVKFADGKQADQKIWLVDPERYIPEDVAAVHGITADMVAGQPLFRDIAPEFLAYVEGCALVAPNANFDVRILHTELQRAGLPRPNLPVLDSLPLFRRWYPNLESHTVSALARRLRVSGGALHEAASDCAYTGLVLMKSLRSRRDDLTLGDLYEAAGGAVTL
jgi:DNA polymerase III epsilon subunit family exonuclease